MLKKVLTLLFLFALICSNLLFSNAVTSDRKLEAHDKSFDESGSFPINYSGIYSPIRETVNQDNQNITWKSEYGMLSVKWNLPRSIGSTPHRGMDVRADQDVYVNPISYGIIVKT